MKMRKYFHCLQIIFSSENQTLKFCEYSPLQLFDMIINEFSIVTYHGKCNTLKEIIKNVNNFGSSVISWCCCLHLSVSKKVLSSNLR